MIKNAWFVIILVFAPYSLPANASEQEISPVEVNFSPHQGATRAVVSFILSAKKSIKVAAYSFTSPDIAKALVDAHKNGVEVHVVLDKSSETGRYSSATFLENEKVPLRINHRYAIMHSKYIIVDDVSVETGSFNYTKAAEKNNAENLIVLRDNPSVATQYNNNWQRLWDESDYYVGHK